MTEKLRISGEAEQQNKGSGTWTAGIDALRQYAYQDQQWHLHAIEFHHKDKVEAERIRDEAFSVLSVPRQQGEPVAWRLRHVNDDKCQWRYQEQPIGSHNEYLIVQPLYTTPPTVDDATQSGVAFPYQQTFDAIAAATSLWPSKDAARGISISVAKFQEAFNGLRSSLTPAREPVAVSPQHGQKP